MDWSSAKVIKAVESQGYVRKEGRGRTGTHRVWARKGKPGELHNTATIPVDRKRIATGTMRSIMEQLGVDEPTLERWLKPQKSGPSKATPQPATRFRRTKPKK